MSFASPFPEVDIPSTSVYDYLFGDLDDDRPRPRRARRREVRQRRPRYREMIARIDAFAGALADRGIGVGDVVGLLSPNSSAFAIAFHGILRAGATATTINALFTAKDIAKQLTDSQAKMLVTVTPLLPQARGGRSGSRHLRTPTWSCSTAPAQAATGHPNAADLLAPGLPAPRRRASPRRRIWPCCRTAPARPATPRASC